MFLSTDDRRRFRPYEDDDDAPLPSAVTKKPVKRVTLLQEDERNSTVTLKTTESLVQLRPEYQDAEMQRIWNQYDPQVPVKRTVEIGAVIPGYLHRALSEIINDNGRHLRLNSGTLADLSKCLESHHNDSATVDPLVKLSQTLDLGHSRMYLSEVVPLSVYLMARAFKVEFSIKVTDKVRTNGNTFEEVSVRPASSEKEGRGQPFDVAQLINERIQRMDEAVADLFIAQVRVYMYSLGVMTSEQAVEPETLADALETVAAIKDGTIRLLMNKKGQ